MRKAIYLILTIIIFTGQTNNSQKVKPTNTRIDLPSNEENYRTYYVDQTAGNDANSGTNRMTAWKNCPGMEAYSGSGILQPGDTVYFDNSDTWMVAGKQGIYLVGGVTYLGDSWGPGTMRQFPRCSKASMWMPTGK